MANSPIYSTNHRKHEKHALPLAVRSRVVLTLPVILSRCKYRDNFSKNNGFASTIFVI